MKIVCGTDFSVHAGEAATVAAALAARSNSTLKLVHAISPAQMQYLPVTQVVWLRDELRRKLIREGRRLRALGAEILESLVIGAPHEVLTMAAKQSKADLIIVSSLGHVSPMRWLAGSVAERTAQHSTVPTLVVRDHESLLSWTKGKRALKVFVGYDFSASSDAALRWAASLTQVGSCHVTVAYVSWSPKETWRFGVGGHSSLSENDLIVRTLLERDLKEQCARISSIGMPKLRVVSNWGQVDDKLIELAAAEAADLIVLGTNQRRGFTRFWLGSVSRGVLHHATANVICVPAPEERSPVAEPIPNFRRVLVPTDFSKHGNRTVTTGIGSRGCSGLKKKLLGSATEGLIRSSTRPILFIRE